MSKPILAYVVTILNEREIAINAGSEKGVEKGMFFNVLEQPLKIVDPSTGADLGSLQRIKIRVRVNHVDSKFCVATTFRKRDGFFVGDWASLLMPSRVETLKLEDHSRRMWNAISEKDSVVKLLDPVVQVLPEPSQQVKGSE